METESIDFTEEMETVSQEFGSEMDPPEETGTSEPEETSEALESEEPESLEETEETSEESEDYITPDMLESLLAEYSESAVTDEELVTLWNKPLADYSVSEGLLLIIFVLLLWIVISRQIGGRFK